MLGDINIGEPKALIGFAGPRVIQQTVRDSLPEGFQRSEFLLEHGALDMIVDSARNARPHRRHAAVDDGQRAPSGLSSPGPSCGRFPSGSPTKNGCTRSRSIWDWDDSPGVLERLRWTQPRVPVITIAGTNGKGSVAAYCTSILAAAGLKVGTAAHARSPERVEARRGRDAEEEATRLKHAGFRRIHAGFTSQTATLTPY